MFTVEKRRRFLRFAAAAAAGTAVAPLAAFYLRESSARQPPWADICGVASVAGEGFGRLGPGLPLNTRDLDDIAGVGDLRGVPLLALPQGFQYRALSIRGQEMSDGVAVPGDHDGMGCFAAPGGGYVLVRNHELSPHEEETGAMAGCLPPNGNVFDRFRGEAAGLGGGGTTTLLVDALGRRVSDHVSLGGTYRNCAGGTTPWSSWISCEETVATPDDDDTVTLRHGYNFEVPSAATAAVEPVPLVAMGRMNHEAVTVDPRDGCVYQTEDRKDSAFYRFVPASRPTAFGHLQRGGALFALAIRPGQRSRCTGEPLPTLPVDHREVVDTRGLGRGAAGSMLPFVGQPLATAWVRLDDVDPAEDTLRLEARAKGGTVFWRGEGAFFHGGIHYWVCSGAGDIGEGQVWAYDPKTATVRLVLESTSQDLLDGPDNLTVAGDGTLYLAEDGSRGRPGQAHYGQSVVGVDGAGRLFRFAHNVIPGDTSEFAGVCFSPDGRFLFVNSQGIGITYAISRVDRRPIHRTAGQADRVT